MHKFDEVVNTILKLLSNKDWHRIDEIVERTKVSKDKAREAIEFLNKFSFAEVRGEEVRITSLGLKLFEL